MTRTIYASSVAKLDSSVVYGGGTDDTEALQKVLDLAAEENTGLHLIMDGAALISRLRVHSDTTIECLNKDCGFYQKDWTNDSMLTNANWDNYELKTKNISLIGGTYNQNCLHQTHDNQHTYTDFCMVDETGHREKTFTLCIEFYGVEDLLVRDITIRAFRTFAFTVGCFRHVTVENVWLDMQHHMNGNQDGFHFWGPGQYLTVRNCGGCVSDDIMNIGPDERDKISSITDVLVDGLFLDDAEQAVRLLSRGSGRLDRVTIRNVTGQYRSFGFYIDPWFHDELGNFGNIFIENVDLKEHPHTYEYRSPILFSVAGNIECLTLKNIRHHNGLDRRPLFDFGLPFGRPDDDPERAHRQRIQTIIIDGLTVTESEEDACDRDYMMIYDRIDTLVLKNILVLKNQKEENGTLIRFLEDGEVGTLLSESVYTKGLKTVISDPSKVLSELKENKI